MNTVLKSKLENNKGFIKLIIFTWQVTAKVWQICVLPVLNSPNISVIEPVSIPPPNRRSNSFDPVVNWMISDLLRWNIVAEVKPSGTIFDASAYYKQL